ncbi:MAG: NADPH:quinone reductase [Hyphomicrobiaceae bacterium]
MKQAFYTTRGAAREVLQLRDAAAPTPAAGEVAIRMRASGVNPSDVKTRAGSNGPLGMPMTVPHNDGAGVITAVGAGVPTRRVGEHVWLFNVNRTVDGAGQGERGTAAEDIVVDARLAVPLPHGISFEAGACLGVPAMTAHRCVMADGSVKGQTVLVTGGAGAVGAMAIQIAKWSGARVIATVSSEAKASAARADGADATINYKAEDVGARVLALNNGQRIDRIVDVDFAAHTDLATRVLKTSGVIASYASMTSRTPAIPFGTLMFMDTTLRMVLVYVMPWSAKVAAMQDITTMLEADALRPRVAASFPLSRIVEAHEMQEVGTHIGNVVVTMQ